MILAAAILLFGIYSPGLRSQDNPVQAQPTASNSVQSPQSSPEQTRSSASQATATSNSDSSTVQEPARSSKASTAKKRGRKKKLSIAPCDAGNSAGQTGSTNSSTSPSATQPSGASATPPSTNCPPQKVIVQQGGTAEPSIQLAGGDQAAQKRAAVNQMLGSTEANLKKIAGLQLSDDQKGTVVQIRQFVDQSKTALADGDLERGHTLAWKAQILSEDLVQPPK